MATEENTIGSNYLRSVQGPHADDVPLAVAKPELTDDFHLDEPLAYLVKCYDDTLHEYLIFTDEGVAKRFAENQEDLAEGDEDGDGPHSFDVYPLYAGHPLE